MRFRSFLHLIPTLVLLSSLLACNIGVTPPAPTTPTLESTATSLPPTETPTAGVRTGTGLCANSLYPIIKDATWSYAGDSGSNGSYNYTDTITDVREDGFTITSLFNNSLSRTQQWACKPEGLVALQIPGAAAAIAMQQLNVQFETSNVQGVILPASVTPGSKWSFSLDFKGTMSASGITADTTGTGVYDFTAAGVESVTVPAGTFDAQRIDGVLTLNATATVSGLPLPLKLTFNTSSWWAPGVGMVRTLTTGDLIGTPINDRLELQSYNIP